MWKSDISFNLKQFPKYYSYYYFYCQIISQNKCLPQKQTLQILSCFIQKNAVTNCVFIFGSNTLNCAEVSLTLCSLNPKDTVNFQQYLQDLWKSSLLLLHSTANSGLTFLFFLCMQNSLHLVYFNLNPNIFLYLIFLLCLLSSIVARLVVWGQVTVLLGAAATSYTTLNA
jgi:hypothetical protein